MQLLEIIRIFFKVHVDAISKCKLLLYRYPNPFNKETIANKNAHIVHILGDRMMSFTLQIIVYILGDDTCIS